MLSRLTAWARRAWAKLLGRKRAAATQSEAQPTTAPWLAVTVEYGGPGRLRVAATDPATGTRHATAEMGDARLMALSSAVAALFGPAPVAA